MLHAVGFKREDFKKSQIGIASTWSMVTPCNMHIDRLARETAKGVDAANVARRRPRPKGRWGRGTASPARSRSPPARAEAAPAAAAAR